MEQVNYNIVVIYNNMNLESAVLVLRSANASTNTLGSSITFERVNFRALLGGLYDKYDMFKICLTSISNFNTNAISSNFSDRFVSINMTGLNFVNAGFSYNTTNGGDLTNSTTICNVDLSGTASQGRTINLTGEIGQNFTINNPNSVDLTFTLSRINDGGLNTAQNYGNWIFIFSIYGVDKE